MNRNKRVVSQPPPSRNPTTAAASAAAALAFAKKQQADAGLSAAAAAAALRSHATTPVPISEIQTKRMVRRGSTSSFGSNAGSIIQTFGRPGLQRRTSSSSMTERTFRSPSPGPNRRRAPSITSISEVPVPAIPSKIQGRPASFDPQMRTSMTSPTPSTSSRIPPRKSTPGGSLAKVPEQRERENVEAGRSVNFSRPMSPPPMATRPKEAVRTRPASSQGFYPAQNTRVQPQQQSQAQRQAPAMVKKTMVPRAESILEEPSESPPSRKAASAVARPASVTPRAKATTASAPSSTKAVPQSMVQANTRPMSQAPIKSAIRPGATAPQSSPKVAARPASAMSHPSQRIAASPTSAMSQQSQKVAARPASAMSQPRQPAVGATPQNRIQPLPRPASALAQSRPGGPAWPPSALVQQTPQKNARPASTTPQSRPASTTPQTRPPTSSAATPVSRGDAGGKPLQKTSVKIDTDIPQARATTKASVAAQSMNSPITVPSPTQEQMRTFQTRASMLASPTAGLVAAGRPSNTTNAGDKQMTQPQASRPPVVKRVSTSSLTTQQRDRTTSQPITNLAPATNVRRTPSASPARSARFSTTPLLDATKHKPPPRATSPAKSALKPASLRTSSPESSYRQGTSDNSDSRSVRSVESSSKKKKAVNFDETPQVLSPGKGVTSSTKSMWMAEPKPEISRTPALPSFESVRGRKVLKDSNVGTDQPSAQSSLGIETAETEQTEQGGATSMMHRVPDNTTTSVVQQSVFEQNDEELPESTLKTITTPETEVPMEERTASAAELPHISVVPATPHADENTRSFASPNVPATIVDDVTIAPYHDQGTIEEQSAVSYPPGGSSVQDSIDLYTTSGEYVPSRVEPTTTSESHAPDSPGRTILPGAYSRTITSFAPGTSTYEYSGPAMIGLGAFTPTSNLPTVFAGVYNPRTEEHNPGDADHAHEFVNGAAESTEEPSAVDEQKEIPESEELEADAIEDESEGVDAENRALSAIYEGAIVDHLAASETHPAFRSPNVESDSTVQQTSTVPPEEDWERVRAYWSSLSEQRKQQLEVEAGIVHETNDQLDSSELAQDEAARFETPPRQVPKQANNRFASTQAPLPPWPDQQYQQSMRRDVPMKQSSRPVNQRMTSDPANGRPQSAYAVPRNGIPRQERPASISGDSPSKSATSLTAKPLKGVLKNANAPQPPLNRTFSNDSSGSESSFKKERQQRRRGNSSHSMKRTMRSPLPPSTGSYEGRPTSPTPIRGNKTISPSPSNNSLNRPIRMSMRGAPQSGPAARVPDQAPSMPAKGGFSSIPKSKVPSKAGSRFKSRFDDSSDEDDARPSKRKITGIGGFSKGGGGFSKGGGGFSKGGGGFRSRFADSDDEEMGSPGANGHAQGSSLMSGTMRNSIDGASPKKRALFSAGNKKTAAGIYEESEDTPTSPSRYSKMLSTMRQPEQEQAQPSSRPSVFRRISLSRSAQTIPGASSIDDSVPVPSIPDEYKQSRSGGMLAAKIASSKAPLSNGMTKEEIVSTRTGKKKRFQGLRRALGLND